MDTRLSGPNKQSGGFQIISQNFLSPNMKRFFCDFEVSFDKYINLDLLQIVPRLANNVNWYSLNLVAFVLSFPGKHIIPEKYSSVNIRFLFFPQFCWSCFMRMFREKKIPNLDGFLDLVWVNNIMLTTCLRNVFLGVFLDFVRRVDSGWGLGYQHVFLNIQFAVLG